MEEFYPTYPLYRKYNLGTSEISEYWLSVNAGCPPFMMHCPECKRETTFNRISIDEERPSRLGQSIAKTTDKYYVVIYLCQQCQKYDIRYVILFEKSKVNYIVKKIGQYPAMSIEPTKEVAEFLGEADLVLYRKGLANESQSYGIGAHSYYRRIVENKIDTMISMIEEIAEAENDTVLLEKIVEARSGHTASEKIKIIKDYLPASLKPGGQNTFGLLYEQLSEGIHKLSDEECLERAVAIRTILDFLVKRLEKEKAENEKFKTAVSKLNGLKQ